MDDTIEYLFHPHVITCGKIPTDDLCVEDEPMLYSASVGFAIEKGGPITRRVISKVLEDEDFDMFLRDLSMTGYHPIIDTKTVLLMPGQYPCIPGWHCDAVPRRKDSGQPDLSTLNERVYHYIFSTSDVSRGEHCGTDIFLNPLKMDPKELDSSKVWGSVNTFVESYLQFSANPVIHTGKDELVCFNRSTLHRGTMAKARQWRYFFRLSFMSTPPACEVRKQVQIYADVNHGW